MKLLALLLICAQFEVATVKRSPPPQGDRINMNLGNIRNGRLTLENATLADCLKFAYGLYADAQLAAPAWVKSKEFLFDVTAKTPEGATREQNLAMLRTLLIERLAIRLHHEQREISYLALVPVKEGSKLKPAAEDATPSGPSLYGNIFSQHMTMHALALLLSRFEKQTVLDLTHLDGAYEVSLQWNPEQASADDDRPSLYTALPKQLGLRLEARRGPVDVLVVDAAEKTPAEN